MARGMCQAEVTSSQRSPAFGCTSALTLTAFSQVLRALVSSRSLSSSTPRSWNIARAA